MKGFAVLIAAGLLIAAGRANLTPGPTEESALDAERKLGDAMRTNDPDALCRLLDPDWAIVTGIGDLSVGQRGDGTVKQDVCAAVKSGKFIRTSYDVDLATARVRVYGNVATVTFKLSAGGPFRDKKWHGKEVQTDVLKWEDGGWKAVLTHETNVEGTVVIE